MSTLLLFHKPFGVLSQFTAPSNAPDTQTLATYIIQPHVYAAGRLDKDSEGLLLLTGDGALQNRIASPKHKMPKTYWAQVEGIPGEEALQSLRNGLRLKDGMTQKAQATLLVKPPTLEPRTPPIRERKNKPTSWISLTISEGRNRQVRRMTAAVGFPTLRLIRYSVGNWTLQGLAPGELRSLHL